MTPAAPDTTISETPAESTITSSPSPPTHTITHYLADRHIMVILCTLCTALNYADRVNMSIAIISLSKTYSFPVSQQSLILSSFFLGYIPMQLGGALLCRRAGGKRILAVGATSWSIFTILTPPSVAIGGLPLLLACRVAMGLAEGVAFPSVYHFLAAWIPESERARAISAFISGTYVGTVIALVVAPFIVDALDWRFIFYIFGSAGFFWVALWQLLAYDAPSSSQRTITPSPSFDALPSTSATLTTKERAIIRKTLTNRHTLSVCISQFIYGITTYAILSWLPTYFEKVYEISTKSLSLTFFPYATMCLSGPLSGHLSDALISAGTPTAKTRKLVTIIGTLGFTLSLLAFTRMGAVWSALLFSSVSMGFLSMNGTGFEAAYLDVATPEWTGLFKAVSNTLGALSGFLSAPISTVVLGLVGGSWRLMFASLGGWILLQCVVFCALFEGGRVLGVEGGEGGGGDGEVEEGGVALVGEGGGGDDGDSVGVGVGGVEDG